MTATWFQVLYLLPVLKVQPDDLEHANTQSAFSVSLSQAQAWHEVIRSRATLTAPTTSAVPVAHQCLLHPAAVLGLQRHSRVLKLLNCAGRT